MIELSKIYGMLIGYFIGQVIVGFITDTWHYNAMVLFVFFGIHLVVDNYFTKKSVQKKKDAHHARQHFEAEQEKREQENKSPVLTN